ncbi:D-glycero-alpha-D-manno-heptose-1,7-bisphosphate 7-phosphatase [Alteromonas lipolytica]|uniref:D,D-heptose 1,7-bisphosphate phosphatase n=1 Tax=Alteromonas lipolytica TaxID=1856405 RepID=A0A1E8FF27_9ALTE|nr:HAD family hydrolase [Alteromonas lipolytica]OFI34532.1 hypothetical protein BFC17_18025 [Alteromonas lipolytica]GGF85330.1 D,D-heptose 1,7-bisphosphate phosphatase [Alteromonas lipolytica]
MTKLNRKAFFLDRDGVINVDHGYVSSPDSFEFVAGVFEACKIIVNHGYDIIIVTNQAGIGRGYYSEEQFAGLTVWMREQFKERDIHITDVRYCPHHATHGQGEYLKDCAFRKPNPGMIVAAAREHGINVAESVLVGDKMSDIQAGQSAGIPALFLVDSHYDADGVASGYQRCGSLLEAVRLYFA